MIPRGTPDAADMTIVTNDDVGTNDDGGPAWQTVVIAMYIRPTTTMTTTPT